jgi:hypothetical protein
MTVGFPGESKGQSMFLAQVLGKEISSSVCVCACVRVGESVRECV